MNEARKRPTTLVMSLTFCACLWSILGGIYILKWPRAAVMLDGVISLGILIAVYSGWREGRTGSK